MIANSVGGLNMLLGRGPVAVGRVWKRPREQFIAMERLLRDRSRPAPWQPSLSPPPPRAPQHSSSSCVAASAPCCPSPASTRVWIRRVCAQPAGQAPRAPARNDTRKARACARCSNLRAQSHRALCLALREQGITTIGLNVTADNAAAISMYARLGFRTVMEFVECDVEPRGAEGEPSI